LLNSMSYKSALGIAKGTHTNNKRAAVQFCINITGRKFLFKENHLCDCINQLFFVLHSKYSGREFKFVFE
jgi:hypothetical protein